MPDDVVDVMVLMLREVLLLDPYAHRRLAIVTRSLALAMLKLEYATNQILYMMEDIIYGYKTRQLILMLIVNEHTIEMVS